jgi:coiled-coil domain-containing protein 12
VVFRNYAPQDVALNHEDVDYEEPNSKRTKVNVKSAFDAALEETVLETSNTATSLAPKKVNWDVKRDIEEKMDKLERKTDRSKGSAFQGETDLV